MNWIDQLAVYLVIGRKDCTIHPPIEVVKQALSAGVKTIQLREKRVTCVKLSNLDKKFEN